MIIKLLRFYHAAAEGLGDNRGVKPWKPRVAFLGALGSAVWLKAWLVAAGLVPFNSDEAILALMARHIRAGARPVFFYGQAYMGSLDAFLIAAGFALFGERVWVLRLVQGLLYLATLATTAWLGRAALGRWETGALAAWFLAIPTVNVTLYTTATLGNYGEALLAGNLILILTLRIATNVEAGMPDNLALWLLWGLLAGGGLWVFGLTLVYSLPAGVLLAWIVLRRARQLREPPGWRGLRPLVAALVGALLGAIPWWGFAVARGVEQLINELGGSAIAGVEGLPYWASVGQHTVNFLVLGLTVILGLRPPWEVRWFAPLLLPAVLAFWMAVALYTAHQLVSRKRTHTVGAWLLVGVMATLVAGFLLTPFGADPSGRYFLPLAAPMALFAADGVLAARVRFGRWVWLAPALILGFNLWGTVASASRYPPGLTTQFDPVTQIDHRYDPQLMEFLRAQGELRGFTNYWVAYPLAFLSQEELIYIPRLPYHPDFRYTLRDDRFEPYRAQIAQASRLAYITTHHPTLDERLRTGFKTLEVTWQEIQIGDYRVFYALSRPVQPSELGLGETTP